MYHENQHLFSKIINAKNRKEIDDIFNKVKASDYWDNHFNFGKISTVIGEKKLTIEFVNLVLINAILPLKYSYHKNSDEEILDEIIQFYESIPAEKNSITDQWKNLKVEPKNALQTQALLYHYRNFCLKKNCLQCSIGLQLMNSN